jgi:hypothetical protein
MSRSGGYCPGTSGSVSGDPTTHNQHSPGELPGVYTVRGDFSPTPSVLCHGGGLGPCTSELLKIHDLAASALLLSPLSHYGIYDVRVRVMFVYLSPLILTS